MTDYAGLIERLREEEARTQKLFDFIVMQRDKNPGLPAFGDINQIKHALAGRDPVLEPAADAIAELVENRCETCGAVVSSYRNGCPMCGAPQCCQPCCRLAATEAERDKLRERLAQINLALTGQYEWEPELDLVAVIEAMKEQAMTNSEPDEATDIPAYLPSEERGHRRAVQLSREQEAERDKLRAELDEANARIQSSKVSALAAIGQLSHELEEAVEVVRGAEQFLTKWRSGALSRHSADKYFGYRAAEEERREFDEVLAPVRAFLAQHAPSTSDPVQGPRVALCSDCPPVGYPTDDTRCAPCPRRAPVQGPFVSDDLPGGEE